MHTDSTHVNRKTAQREATRERLVAAGRELFGARGFAGVGTEEIVRAAGVTRGALYHGFADKRDLFRAVVEHVEAELMGQIAEEALTASGPLEALRAGARRWLDVSLDPEIHRIVLLDAPAVLGWEEWRAIGERHALGLVVGTLEAAMEAGAIARQPARALGHIVVAAVDEAALYVARSADPKAARAEADVVLARLLDGLAG
jgi:AcrR family transcriptional regulator